MVFSQVLCWMKRVVVFVVVVSFFDLHFLGAGPYRRSTISNLCLSSEKRKDLSEIFFKILKMSPIGTLSPF